MVGRRGRGMVGRGRRRVGGRGMVTKVEPKLYF